MKIFTIGMILFIGLNLQAQTDKKIINQETYDLWKSIKNEHWSPDGQLITYEINPAKGDGYLFIQSTETLEKDSILKGKNAKIHYLNKYVVFNITPGYDTLRTLKLEKTKKEKMPKDTLGIFWIGKDSLMTIPKVKSYRLAAEGDWMAYLSETDERADCPTYKKWQIIKKRRKCEKEKTAGSTLHLLNPLTSSEIVIDKVMDYKFNKSGNFLIYSISQKGKSDSLTIMSLNLQNTKYDTLLKNQLEIKDLTFDEAGTQMVFLNTIDTNKIKTFQLRYFKLGDTTTTVIADTLFPGMNAGWSVSANQTPYFSNNGRTIYFGTNIQIEQEEEDTLLSNEKAKVDVWSWTDKKVQPQQLKELRYSKNSAFLTKINLDTKKIIHLTESEYDQININTKANASFALVRNDESQRLANSWEFPWPSDYFLLNLDNGDCNLMLNNQGYYPSLSPKSDYLVWYNGNDSVWYSTDTRTQTVKPLTNKLDDIFYSDNNGSPFNPYPEGNSGWVLKDGKEQIIIESENDLWLVDPSNHLKAVCITGNKGKQEQIKYSISSWDRDSAYIDLTRAFIKGVDKESKDEFVTNINHAIQGNKYLNGPHKFYYVVKAKKSDKVFYRKMTVSQYPDLFVTDLSFKDSKQLSHTNPQQQNYNWATVEQVQWKSYKGLELDGLLYKPEDFDSTKNYPMIVYFYEKYDDRLHNYYAPRPTASIVHPTEYASNGYLVFIPNILYTPGHPAKSAYDCILSGTDYLTDKYSWIDTNKLGLQGQSWGGYQTAQLVTMTDKYACGMAGAPVSNMFSAYGGIRWGSGMSRAFQYERTQSRIGCTIWECPELYIENSPIFGLPNVHTPLLIMHNDKDGAVPWYQGIEMFMGLRRLEKPVWLLNYNGDGHNLMQNANREDLSKRMMQFFDFYLKGEAMPLWMKNGVPALEKGNPSNLELEKLELD
ncbi:hypothetical protein DNU06_03150 [Putridiphycobacter roseus]|uniref:Peptidase S9 prolyl oligopeptidase catalytic domain-containing protein n=1 Tax=Putridiphycobacter roseus TaxID=2219161 RepID=A0A2W1NT63_9FLAO|nr:prolyl oligopeptidase family serine peptidase [Putridiphycobacter roseus]PZE18842.1 hypothetical protein DNU06_03150 [Putridiphycobacter roseus]